MFCSTCGTNVTEGSAFCGSCGRPVVGYSVGATTGAGSVSNVDAGNLPEAFPPVSGSVAHSYPANFAGFWLRLVAHLIDGIVASIVLVILGALAVGFLGVEFFRTLVQGMDQPNPVFPAVLVGFIAALFAISLIGSWLYYAGMESSASQGTLGKMAIGLLVTDMEGERLTFGRASGRFFAKIISGMIPFAIGYIMAGFTEKKQALHDMIASCLVLRRV